MERHGGRVSPGLSPGVTHVVAGPLGGPEAAGLAPSSLAVVLPEYLSRCAARGELLDPAPFTAPEVARLRGLPPSELVASPTGDPGEVGARWERLLALRQLRAAVAAAMAGEAGGRGGEGSGGGGAGAGASAGGEGEGGRGVGGDASAPAPVTAFASATASATASGSSPPFAPSSASASALPGPGLDLPAPAVSPSRPASPLPRPSPRLASAALSVLEPSGPARGTPAARRPAHRRAGVGTPAGIRVAAFGAGDMAAWAARGALGGARRPGQRGQPGPEGSGGTGDPEGPGARNRSRGPSVSGGLSSPGGAGGAGGASGIAGPGGPGSASSPDALGASGDIGGPRGHRGQPGSSAPPGAAPDAAQPLSFVQKYHQASRLHHLSAWKLEAREYLISNPPCGPQPLPPGHCSPCLLHVDLDCFFVSATLQGLPEKERLQASARPVFVCSAANLRGEAGAATVASCNYTARALGVRNGMWVRQARRLCPSALVFPYDFQRYREASRGFYDIVRRYSSRVMPVSVDEAYLDVTGLRRPLGRGRPPSDLREFLTLAEAIRAELFAREGLVASVGIGDSLLTARMATKLAKPNGVRILTRESARADLRFRPVEFLPGAGPAVAELIRTRLGCETVGDLQRAPLSKLTEALGLRRGQAFYDACRGEQANPFAGFAPVGGAGEPACAEAGDAPGEGGAARPGGPAQPLTKSVAVVMNYAIRPTGAGDALRVVRGVVEEMAARMERRACRAAPGASLRLKLNVRHPDAPVEPLKYMGTGKCLGVSRSRHLPAGTPPDRSGAVEALYAAARDMAQEMLREFDPRDLRGVELTCDRVGAARYRPGGAKGEAGGDGGTTEGSEGGDQAGGQPAGPPDSPSVVEVPGGAPPGPPGTLLPPAEPDPQDAAAVWSRRRLRRSWPEGPRGRARGIGRVSRAARAFGRAQGPPEAARPGQRARRGATCAAYRALVAASAPAARPLAARALQLQLLQDGDLEGCLALGPPRGAALRLARRNHGLEP